MTDSGKEENIMEFTHESGHLERISFGVLPKYHAFNFFAAQSSSRNLVVGLPVCLLVGQSNFIKKKPTPVKIVTVMTLATLVTIVTVATVVTVETVVTVVSDNFFHKKKTFFF